jgi:hypothetical protein
MTGRARSKGPGASENWGRPQADDLLNDVREWAKPRADAEGGGASRDQMLRGAASSSG